jgi:hypothetical protein
MIIVLNRFGQLGNQLMLFSKFITLALEENLDIMNPAFGEYADSFEYFANNRLASIPPRKIFWTKTATRARVFHAYLRIVAFIAERVPVLLPDYEVLRAGSGKKFNLADSDFVEMSRSKTVFFMEGWPRLQVDYKRQYAGRLREIFRPQRKHQQAISALEEEGRKLGDVLVGMHIRQGDYRNWENGNYFFSSHQYANVMRKVEKLFPGDRVAFFVASDEKQARSSYAEYSAVFGGKNAVEDMYTLAACDYIVGPPSTFSAWASFYGRTPRYTLKDIAGSFTLKDFFTPKA